MINKNKYIKLYEELSPETYRNAAHKLHNLGFENRAKKLMHYSHNEDPLNHIKLDALYSEPLTIMGFNYYIVDSANFDNYITLKLKTTSSNAILYLCYIKKEIHIKFEYNAQSYSYDKDKIYNLAFLNLELRNSYNSVTINESNWKDYMEKIINKEYILRYKEDQYGIYYDDNLYKNSIVKFDNRISANTFRKYMKYDYNTIVNVNKIYSE